MSGASITSVVLRLPFARWAFSGGAARGVERSTDQLGVLWRPSSTGLLPVVIIFSDAPSAMTWLASNVAAKLSAVVLVAGTDIGPGEIVAMTSGRAASLGVDTSRIAVLGEQRGAARALLAAVETSSSSGQTPTRQVARLALVGPRLAETPEIVDLPPTLLQSSRSDEHAAAITSFEKQLRSHGVAVRATDYTDSTDGWTRFPKAVRRSNRALEDLVAFLRRGIGVDSTFDVIPGWDLH